MKRVETACVLLISLAFFACGSDTGTSEEPAETEVYTRTIVWLQADGTQTVKVEPATAEELWAETELREASVTGAIDGTIHQAITKDSSCAGSSLWIQDQTNQQGNRICFYGAGETLLSNYCRVYCGGYPYQYCCGYWENNVRSYWGGTDEGVFLGNDFVCNEATCAEIFSAYYRRDSAGNCAQLGDWLRLQAQTCF